MKQLGIVDVAAAAGVSPSTVSHVYSGARPVSAKTRARVLAAAERLHYRPHPGAQALRTRRTSTVTLIVADISNPFYASVAAGLQDVLIEAGYMLSIVDAALPRRSVRDAIAHAIHRRSDGLVLGAYGASDDDIELIRHSEIKLVRLGGAPDGHGDVVHANDRDAARRITRHLLDQGFRKLAYIGGERTSPVACERASGFADALADAGLSPSAMTFQEFSISGGQRAVAQLVSSQTPVDAIVGGNDLIAIGAIQELRRHGLATPGNVAVTGFDDIEAAPLISPALTTVNNPAREIGSVAAQLLLDQLTNAAHISREVLVRQELIVRESSKRGQS